MYSKISSKIFCSVEQQHTEEKQLIHTNLNHKYLITEDSTLLTSVSDATVCRAMASRAASCFFLRLFKLWEGDHSCEKLFRKNTNIYSLNLLGNFLSIIMISMKTVFSDTSLHPSKCRPSIRQVSPSLTKFDNRQGKRGKALTHMLYVTYSYRFVHRFFLYYLNKLHSTNSKKDYSLPKQSL